MHTRLEGLYLTDGYVLLYTSGCPKRSKPLKKVGKDLQTFSIAITDASEYVPEIVAAKLQQIATENNVPMFHLTLQRELSPCWDKLFLLPRNSRVWFYDGGSAWFLLSDGDLFVEPLEAVDLSLQAQRRTVWVITLDDGAEDLRVRQCILSLRVEGSAR